MGHRLCLPRASCEGKDSIHFPGKLSPACFAYHTGASGWATHHTPSRTANTTTIVTSSQLTGADSADRDTMVSPEKMADERTPLITTVRTAPPRQRYPHHVVRRFCTIALSCSLIALLATFFLGLGPPDHHHHHGHGHGHGRRMSYDELRQVLLETPSSEKAEEWQRYYTAGAHLAGQNFSQVSLVTQPWGYGGWMGEV